jgi:Zn finger protein HypA/HybF involved in hydrogenase expression
MKIPELIDEDISKIHDCEKCHGKMVSITYDKLSNSYCGYCGERIDYFKFIKCPDCGNDDIDLMPGGCSIYPEMGKPTYCCKECRTIFAIKPKSPQ